MNAQQQAVANAEMLPADGQLMFCVGERSLGLIWRLTVNGDEMTVHVEDLSSLFKPKDWSPNGLLTGYHLATLGHISNKLTSYQKKDQRSQSHSVVCLVTRNLGCLRRLILIDVDHNNFTLDLVMGDTGALDIPIIHHQMVVIPNADGVVRVTIPQSLDEVLCGMRQQTLFDFDKNQQRWRLSPTFRTIVNRARNTKLHTSKSS